MVPRMGREGVVKMCDATTDSNPLPPRRRRTRILRTLAVFYVVAATMGLVFTAIHEIGHAVAMGEIPAFATGDPAPHHAETASEGEGHHAGEGAIITFNPSALALTTLGLGLTPQFMLPDTALAATNIGDQSFSAVAIAIPVALHLVLWTIALVASMRWPHVISKAVLFAAAVEYRFSYNHMVSVGVPPIVYALLGVAIVSLTILAILRGPVGSRNVTNRMALKVCPQPCPAPVPTP